MIHFLAPSAGVFSMEEYLAYEGPRVTTPFSIEPFENVPSRSMLQRGTYVLAGLDQLDASAMHTVTRLSRVLAESRVRVLNDPERTLHRFDLLRTLHQRGRNAFDVRRATDDLSGLRFPVYLRQERFHGGNVSPLLHSVAEVERALGRALVQGFPLGDLLITEFCGTANAAGEYRKYAAFKVGARIIGRSCYVGREWMLKFEASDFTRAIALEERAYVVDNPHAEQLAEIFALGHVDFGQIDYSMLDGRIQTWEINLNPTIGRTTGPSGGVGPRDIWPIRDESREVFFDRFREAWADVDTPDSSGAPIRFAETSSVYVAPPQAARDGALSRALLAVAKPVRRAIEPLTAPFLRLIGKAARLGARR